MEIVKKPNVAGKFYPAEADTLKYMIDEYLKMNDIFQCKGEPKAMIVPHAGYLYSGLVAAAGYNCMKKFDKEKKWKILLLGPSHFVSFKGASVPSFDYWETPLGKVKVEKFPLSDLIVENEEAYEQEHSIEVQLPFLQTIFDDFTVYPLCLGELEPEKLAAEIKDFVAQDDVIMIVSSDLSHYYTYDEAIELDELANNSVPKLDIENVKQIDACGIRSILTLMHLGKEFGWEGKFVDYKNSGDTAGDKTRVVGYGCYVFK